MLIGIDALELTFPELYLDMTDLADARGVDPAKGVLLVGVAVPGPKGSVVFVRTAVKSVAKGA